MHCDKATELKRESSKAPKEMDLAARRFLEFSFCSIVSSHHVPAIFSLSLAAEIEMRMVCVNE